MSAFEPAGEAPRIGGYICLSRELTWGWGHTIDAAVKTARKGAGGKGARKGERLVYRLPENAIDGYVDQMGYLRWSWPEDAADKSLKAVIVEDFPGSGAR